ncbi:MAG TPA: divalent metal cation transporter [Pararobbsia sp.]|nr:divalent metal cation transporter [Pararobbsia sp.]
MAISIFAACFIVLSAAAVSNVHHVDVRSTGDATRALKPLVRNMALTVFSTRIVGTGIPALTALSGSGAYARQAR